MTLEADENDQDDSVDQDEQDLDAMFDEIADGKDSDDIGSDADDSEPSGEDDAEAESDEDEGTNAEASKDADTEAKADDDPWKDAPENLRSAFNETQEALKQAQHQAQSNAGRVGAFQRQINELNQKLQQQTTQKPASDNKPPNGAAPNESPSDDVMSEFEEEYPDVAAYIRNQQAASQQTIERLESKVNYLSDSEQQRDAQTQYAAVEAAHPKWEETAKSDGFKGWITQQPANVQALTKSQLASDAIWLFDTYKNSAQPEQEDPEQGSDANADAVDISGERLKRRQAAARTPSKRGQRGSLDGGGDEDAMFNRIASKL